MATATTTIPWGPNGQDVYERTYSRRKADGSMEVWPETVERVVQGSLALALSSRTDAERLDDLIAAFDTMPAGRHLWTSGVPGRQFNRNCHRAGWGPKLSDHFTFTFDELMKGGGVGANYSSTYHEQLPLVAGSVTALFALDPEHPDYAEVSNTPGAALVDPADWQEATHICVPDDREGWVEALGTVVDTATVPGEHVILFILSSVRPRGSKIHGFGGTASGPGPLAEALAAAATVLDGAYGRHLRPMEAMTLDHAVASCVIAGNTRRSARMSILHWRDPDIFEFIVCKTDPSQHWSTNISVEVDDEFFAALDADDEHAVAVFEAVTMGMLTNGEPGFYNSSMASVGERADVRATNPCGEIALEEWESCNLGHVNLAHVGQHDDAEAEERFRLMARFLVRATFADLTDPRQVEVEARNRRIGVGFFGFQEWLGAMGLRYSQAHTSPNVYIRLRTYANAVRREADLYCDELGIPRCIKVTTVAPTGTIAKLSGNTEGMHPVYSRYYERRVRYAADDPLLEELAKTHPIEDCVYSANTKVVVYTVRDTILDHLPEEIIEQANEISVWDMLATQRLVQEAYADNAVSFTVNVDPSLPIEELRAALREHLPHLKGTTVMPDASRPQAPYTRLSREQYEAATVQDVGQSFDACASGACPVR